MICSTSLIKQPLAPTDLAGSWCWHVTDNAVVLDRGSADLLAGNRDLAGKPLDLKTSFRCLHPDDRERVFALIDEHEQLGGPIALDYRVVSAEGRVRTLLDYGHIGDSIAGGRFGHGLLFDITDKRELVGPTSSGQIELLSDVAERCLDIRDALKSEGTPMMQLLVDMLLLELGRSQVDSTSAAAYRLQH